MSSISLHQALSQLKWFTPQQIDEARLARLVDERIYEVRKWTGKRKTKQRKDKA